MSFYTKIKNRKQNKNLSLNIDLVEVLEIYAKKRGISISKFVEITTLQEMYADKFNNELIHMTISDFENMLIKLKDLYKEELERQIS